MNSLSILAVNYASDDKNVNGKKKQKRIQNYKQREKGEFYYAKKLNSEKWNYKIPKTPRVLKPRCNCLLSQKTNSKIQCQRFSEIERFKIFNRFWKMTWGEKKIFADQNTTLLAKSRERSRKI